MVSKTQLFVDSHGLPKDYVTDATLHYLPLTEWIADQASSRPCLVVAICGGQGTGKSTLTNYLSNILQSEHRLNVATLALDDYYLPRPDRLALAKSIHPLLATRGVPGTHDVELLHSHIEQVRKHILMTPITVPTFDKAMDDRAPAESWTTVSAAVDVAFLEGWCVGAPAQSDADLEQPINVLERDEDPDSAWRRFVNDQLAGSYRTLFRSLDKLIYLRAPDLGSIRRWREKQEMALAKESRVTNDQTMSAEQIFRFVQHYERLTRHMSHTLARTADVTLEFATSHRCRASHYRSAVRQWRADLEQRQA